MKAARTRAAAFLVIGACQHTAPAAYVAVVEPVEARISVLDGQATLMFDATVIGTPDDVSLENCRVVDLLVREADGTAIGFDGSSASQFANGSTVRVVLNVVPRGGFVFLRGWVAVDGVFAGRYALPAVARVY